MNCYTSGKFISWEWWHLLLLFALFDVVASQSIIQTLPGYPGILPIKLETGYVSVGEVDEVQLFYYFVESERNPVKDPLVLWLTGGPGCSAFSGLVYEIGPLMFDVPAFNGSSPSFFLNPYSWTKIANIIFLDAPVGTGFSYATTSEGYYSSDTKSTKDTYTFLRKWLLEHQRFIENPLYIAGDSYSGILVPMIVLEISNANEVGYMPRMSLQGYMLGNPATHLHMDYNARIAYAHRVGLISDNYYQCTGRVNRPHILEPKCSTSWGKRYNDYSKDILIPSQQEELWCRDNYVTCYVWANDPTVREALHIRDGTKSEWRRCNKSLSYEEDIASVVEYHRLLSKKGYRVLIYSGDHDMVIPYVGTVAWINSLNLTIDDNWRPWFVDGQVAGWEWWHLLLLFALFHVVASQSIIQTLPGYPGILPIKLETGYVSVGEVDEVQLFYYFVESERNPVKDPLVLWLTGGPGCSAFSGLVYEIGPLMFDVPAFNGSSPSFFLNPYSWTKIANIIFLDAPVGTGFSYATTSEGYYSSDTKSAKDTYTFLRKWLLEHQRFIENPLYIAGDSYSGILVPMIVLEISNANEVGYMPRMSLQGYMLGNPGTDIHMDENARVAYAHRVGLISDEYYQSAKRSCRGEYVSPDPNNAECIYYLQLIKECTGRVNIAQILEPQCSTSWGKRYDDYSKDILMPSQQEERWCRYDNYVTCYVWANDPTVREALHIRDGTKSEWRRCNESLSYEEEIASVVEYHRLLSEKGYRVLIYSGDHDMVIPYVGTVAWINSLNLTIDDNWRPWFVDGQVAGFTERYTENSIYSLTFATVKGGGHTAPEYKPKECLAMVDRWFSFYPL
ncbi:hypothetical protein RJ640_018623 [Escallonia rubra]|uniref:Uncharacterized protein n=1 Tax=Escallonia rubra TaxID=112253 RepID=A0AA88R829_9ASTE|nr:hypothetical protein RJ640_018623 [Escallonia rubra]